jgi:voltage-gated potassium channel
MSQLRQFRGPLILLVVTLTLGVLGYRAFEGYDWLDALFLTVITVTTVGFGLPKPATPAGEIFIIILIIVGSTGVLYTLSAVFGWLLQTNWPEQRRRLRMEQSLRTMTNHFIVCGYGRVGRSVAEALRRERIPLVVVDVNQMSLANAEADGYAVVVGDAATDEVLRKAGIERARGLIAAVDSDADNVYVVLSARELKPNLVIVARASSDDAAKKLERAGATHVLSPYTIAGQRMAMLAVRPAAVELVETLLNTSRESLLLEEVVVETGSELAQLTLADLHEHYPNIPMIVGLRTDGKLTPAPPSDYRLQPGDTVVLVGSPAQLKEIEKLS